MALDIDDMNQQREAANQARQGGSVTFLKKGTVRLRIPEFVDAADGKTKFARKIVRWVDPTNNGKFVCVDRMFTWGLPDAFAAMEDYTKSQGSTFKYQRRQIYAVNAIDVDVLPLTMTCYGLAQSVWEAIINFASTPDWAAALEIVDGVPFTIEGKGDGLAREYPTTTGRESWPIPAELVPHIRDPYDFFPDIGLEAQAAILGYDLASLFPNGVERADEIFSPPGVLPYDISEMGLPSVNDIPAPARGPLGGVARGPAARPALPAGRPAASVGPRTVSPAPRGSVGGPPKTVASVARPGPAPASAQAAASQPTADPVVQKPASPGLIGRLVNRRTTGQ